MDIDYIKDNYRFNARVSGIIYNKDNSKVLLFKIKNRDYYMLPGGRINMYEDSKSAIKREILEETGYNIDFKFAGIQENFLLRDNIKITQYCFCYKGIYKGTIDSDKFVCKDNDEQLLCWVDVDKLSNYKVYPESNIKLISSDNLMHIIEKKEN